MTDPFAGLPRGHFGAILADPPWRFATWDNREAIPSVRSSGCKKGDNVSADIHYETMSTANVCALPVRDLAAADCSLFLWCSWPQLHDALKVIEQWGFVYKTCAFDWMKAHAGQLEMFRGDADALMGMGYWTRANSEPCLLATRGKPKRLDAGVRQGIIEPRREHSRKPDCVHGRIERLVAGPYLELFARQSRPGWATWGDQATKFDSRETPTRPRCPQYPGTEPCVYPHCDCKDYDGQKDFAGSLEEGYGAIRERQAAGGPGWTPK